MIPPRIGASQNSQSCASAHPPTSKAGPVLRAGFTEVLVTGMLIRWIRVRVRPIASGAKPDGARVSVAHDDKQEAGGEHEFADEAGNQGIAARRMLAVAVAGKSSGEIEALFSTGDYIEHERGDNRAGQLSQDVGQQLAGRSAAAGEQADRNRRVEMSARDAADRIGHRHDGQPKRSATPTRPMPISGNLAAKTALPQPPKTSQKVPMNSAPSFLDNGMAATPS